MGVQDNRDLRRWAVELAVELALGEGVAPADGKTLLAPAVVKAARAFEGYVRDGLTPGSS